MSKAEKTKAFIVEQTAPLFNMKGYAGTSISDLTEATGLTKGSIYGNFANKDEVALAAFDHNMQQVRKVIEGQLAGKKGARERLLVYVDVYENFLQLPFPKGGCPILNTAVEADDTHALLREKAVEAIQRWKRALTGIVEAGIREGEFKKAGGAEAFAVTMIAMIEGAIMLSKVSGKLQYRAIVLGQVREMIARL